MPRTESWGDFARRDKYVVAIANAMLRLASKNYRAAVKVSVLYGLEAAARDLEERTTTVYLDQETPCEPGTCILCDTAGETP